MGYDKSIKELKIVAADIRESVLKALSEAGSGHTGGSLSIVEILITLYYRQMKHNPKVPDMPDRDYFILSKGHGVPALYAVLSKLGYFPESEMSTLRKLGSRLQGHPQKGLPGVEISSGSLGQGLSVAVGIALGLKMDNKKDQRVYCLVGDGEANEGQMWEAAMTAAHYRLDNLCVIMDKNDLQIDGMCCDVMNMDFMEKRWQSFGWSALEADGHDIDALTGALDHAGTIKSVPTIIIAKTVKGKGVSFVENQVGWHGIAPKKDHLEKALKELEEYKATLK